MVGFWRDICAKPKGLDIAGAGQPFPSTEESKYSWIHEIPLDESLTRRERKVSVANSELLPVHVGRIWQRVDDFAETCKSHQKIILDVTHQSVLPDYNTCFQGF